MIVTTIVITSAVMTARRVPTATSESYVMYLELPVRYATGLQLGAVSACIILIYSQKCLLEVHCSGKRELKIAGRSQ